MGDGDGVEHIDEFEESMGEDTDEDEEDKLEAATDRLALMLAFVCCALMRDEESEASRVLANRSLLAFDSWS